MLGAVTVSPDTLAPIINQMSQKYGIEPELIKGVIKTESNWDLNASRYEVHKADASWGLMQLMLATARDVLGDPNLTTTQLIQPATNIEAGTKLLANNLKRWGTLHDAVAAYNAGSPRFNKDGSFVNQAYVDKVFNAYNTYITLGSNPVAEAAIDVSQTAIDVASSDLTPVYIFAGLVAVGVVFMSSSKSKSVSVTT
jgi:soluble lytic murein transglycosylase-like protein